MLNDVLVDLQIEGTIVCESRGDQTIDAIEMQNDYQKKLNK